MQIVKDCDLFYKKSDLPELRIGDKTIVTIYLELPKEVSEDNKKEKERTQVYEGIIISKHGNKGQIESTITVRKVSQEVGIEKVFLLNSPWLKSIKIISRAKVRRSKLYYLRQRTGKSARLKQRF
jgi:large subunit ribosomal protein L19